MALCMRMINVSMWIVEMVARSRQSLTHYCASLYSGNIDTITLLAHKTKFSIIIGEAG